MNINADSKYEFVAGDSKVIAPGRVVKRIRALVAIASFNVSPGDLGGYIEAKKNLQVSGNAWVYGDARVYGDAQVYGNARVCGDAQVYGDAQVCGDAQVYGNAQVCGDAQVYGNARVCGNAWVSGNAQVYGDARVCGNAWVYGNAQVCGDARVFGNARVSGDASFLMIGPIGSRRAMLNIYADAKIGVRFSTGCFTGSREQFFAAVTDTHGDSEHGNAYAVALMLADVLVKPCEIEQLAEAA